MKISYYETDRTESSISYLILDSDNQQIGSLEGYVVKGVLITVIKINLEYQGKGLGSQAFNKIYNELSSKNQISEIAGSWHKDEEFSYCENNMSTNLRLFHTNLKNGLTEEDSALDTPTGKWAKGIGYDKCKIKKITPDEVSVIFYK